MITPELLMRMREYVPDPSLSKNHLTGTALDLQLSSEGGLPKGDKIMLYGGPGAGKSSVVLDALANMQNLNPDLKVLYVCIEMTPRQLRHLANHYPKVKEVPILFISNSSTGSQRTEETMEHILNKGWDVVAFDSIAPLAARIRRQGKITLEEANYRLLSMMDRQCEGENERGVATSVIAIQQCTKAGKARGSNTLVHAFGATVELKVVDENNPFSERYITCPKNRFGANLRLYYDLSEGGDVWYDEAALLEEIDNAHKKMTHRKSHADMSAALERIFCESLRSK